jgi:hypothetical protein
MTAKTVETFSTLYERALQNHERQSSRTAVTTLELCRVVYDARKQLKEIEWAEFVQRYQLDGTPVRASRLRKLLTIGKQYELFKPLSAFLPPSETKLAKLARVKEKNRLAALCTSRTVHPLMTVEDVEAVTSTSRQGGRAPAPKKAPLNFAVTVEFVTTEFTVKKARALLKSLEDYRTKYGQELSIAGLVLSHDLEMALLEAERTDAAA